MKLFIPFSALRFSILLVGLVAGVAFAAEQLWTCGMHPQIIKKQPGNCPICGMALTPVRANKAGGTGGERKIKHYKSTMSAEVSPAPAKDSMGMDMVPVYEDAAPSDALTIQIDAVTIQRMNLKTDSVTRGPVRREIRSVGTVTYNERGLHDITTKYEGWIEKLHVNATWTAVKAGEPLFEIYSPDLYNAQLNYIVALRGEGKESGPLTRAALARLQLFDVTPEFIAGIVRSGEPQRTYVFHAPIDGIVIEKMAVAGQMVKPGERIFRLADLSSVWVLAQIYENDLPFVQAGQEATVRATYGRDRELKGEVALILPQIEEQTRTATARIVLPNPEGYLRPGMFVDVRFTAQIADSAVLVPEMAVLRSGERNTVFIAHEGGSFDPREVKLGARTQDGRYQVLAGLKEGERVVTSGQFMLDSESQLREAIQKMLKTTEGGAQAAPAPDGSAKSADAATSPQPFDERVRETMRVLALALADASAALAADDLTAYQQQLPALRAALAGYLESAPQNTLVGFKDALPDPANLDSARRAFEPFSTTVADLARRHHLDRTLGLHVFECPMAPVGGKGRWLQREAGTKNPFFGAKMANCGEELK
jgi:multidrug efflux pump subunit AcrA (membrane-fusion protein)